MFPMCLLVLVALSIVHGANAFAVVTKNKRACWDGNISGWSGVHRRDHYHLMHQLFSWQLSASTNNDDWNDDDDDQVMPDRVANAPSVDINDNNKTDSNLWLTSLRFDSLEFLALGVSIVFVAVVAFFGDSLFATAPSGSTTTSIDADRVLQEDFQRTESSVSFGE